MSELSSQDLAAIQEHLAKVIEVFGDKWPSRIDDDFDEYVAVTRDSVPPVVTEVFRTSQIHTDDESLLGDFLRKSPEYVGGLLAEVTRRQARVDVLTDQVAGRDAIIQQWEAAYGETALRDATKVLAEARSHRRLLARLRDIVSGLQDRDDELLAIRDRTSDHKKALGHERTAYEVRHIAIRLNALVESFDGDPADGSQKK